MKEEFFMNTQEKNTNKIPNVGVVGESDPKILTF